MQLTPRPVLENPVTKTVSPSGGKVSFGFDQDGVVLFPNEIVTGPVVIEGGRNLHVLGGHLVLRDAHRQVVAFNSPHNVFVEGMHADSNGWCDVFAVRNHRQIQTNFTFQNVYAEGPAYNVVDGNCHGDLIQNQGTSGGGLHLAIENFHGVTDAQGFFIPRYGKGEFSATLRNVSIERESDKNWKPLLWVSSDKYGHPTYPVTLEDVWIDDRGAQVYPYGAVTNNVMSFAPETLINGTLNIGKKDLNIKPYVGLNYDRAHFEPAPLYATKADLDELRQELAAAFLAMEEEQNARWQRIFNPNLLGD